MDPRRKVILVGMALGVVAVVLVLGSFAAGFAAGFSRGTGVPVIAQVIDAITHRESAQGHSEHGGMGHIVSVQGNSLTFKSDDGRTTDVTVSERTIIRRNRRAAKISDLKPGDSIVVVGSPGSPGGKLDARLIRVLSPNTSDSSSLRFWIHDNPPRPTV